MGMSFDRVRETADAVAQVATELCELLAKVHKVLEFNSDMNISYTPATHVVTAQNAANTLTKNGHGLVNGQKGRMTGATLPAPLVVDTDYWIVGAAANTFQLSLTKGGAAIDLTSDGSGTITFNPVPDYIQEESNGTGNMSGRAFDRTQVANAVGSLAQFRNYMTNAAVTQGDHLGNLNALARAQG